eukprot:816108-Rhodomonas_salina.3
MIIHHELVSDRGCTRAGSVQLPRVSGPHPCCHTAPSCTRSTMPMPDADLTYHTGGSALQNTRPCAVALCH